MGCNNSDVVAVLDVRDVPLQKLKAACRKLNAGPEVLRTLSDNCEASGARARERRKD